jgi:hypothetical protein
LAIHFVPPFNRKAPLNRNRASIGRPLGPQLAGENRLFIHRLIMLLSPSTRVSQRHAPPDEACKLIGNFR